MEPGVIRMFSSSPPPMDDALEDDEDEFGDFGTFSAVGGVPTSISFSELDTPTTFNQTRALNATSPPDFAHSRRPGAAQKSLKDGPNGELQTETLTNGFQGPQRPGPFVPDSQHDFADFSAFSDKTIADVETLDDKQSREFGEHNAVKQELSNSNRTEKEFANFAVFSEDSEGTLDDKQSTTVCSQREVTESEEHDDATQKDHSVPNRTQPIFTDFNAFSEDCTLENDFTGSQTVSKDDDRAFYFKKDETHTNEDCSSLNGNAPDASVCSSDLASESDCGGENGESSKSAAVNGTAEKDRDGGGSETETETSLGRPLSTEALEEFGDMSTTGSVPSPPLQEETATPTGDDEEFGEFGDGLNALECHLEQNQHLKAQDPDEEDDFGDFNSPKFKTDEKTDFSTSESFGNFNSAATTETEELRKQIPPQNAQNREAEQPQDDEFGDFNSPQTNHKPTAGFTESSAATTDETPPPDAQNHEEREEEEREEEEREEEEERNDEEDGLDEFGDFNAPTFKPDVESEAGFSASDGFGGSAGAENGEAEETGWSAFGNEDDGETWAAFGSDVKEEPSVRAELSAENTASLVSLVQQLFSSSFPEVDAPSVDDEALTLRRLMEPETGTQSSSSQCVWTQLEDIHEALGLRFQWGGSCCNKALLCSLGIDTRNILFTGQKKQPVIVPMYAAGLGMLEPVKPVSAAEMIASIAQNSPCSSESVQEALPPVQFDWSSSGLTNPLDASGGSSLLNLDFFGPVEDSESGAGSIPAGVDPELFELTTAKMDSNKKMSDAFARLMSTVQSTSTARKPRREENLSEEALKVISRFPDLSFMTAKVLMFPTTLTPHGAPGAEAESGPGPGPENGAD